MTDEELGNGTERPDYDEVADALFETLAALADLKERLAGGARRSGESPEAVIEQVWQAYDLDDADELFGRTGHKRSNSATPEEWAVDELTIRNDDTGREQEVSEDE